MTQSKLYACFAWGSVVLSIYITAFESGEDVRAVGAAVVAIIAFSASDILKALSKLDKAASDPEPLSSFASKSSENAARSVG